MKLALIHDHLIQDGGAENVLRELQAVYDSAPTYTLLYDKSQANPAFKGRDIRTSFIQRMPLGLKKYQWYLPLMPLATELHNLDGFDVVLSSSSAFSKGVITKSDTLHICYCHTPTRYLWSDSISYVKKLKAPKIIKTFLPPLLSRQRMWDKQAAARVDLFIANSETVRRRIKKYYHRDSLVVHPPVEVRKFEISNSPKEYYLAGGRLVSYKRYDMVIQACNRLRYPLKIFGNGPFFNDLKKLAGHTVEFLGRVSDKKRAELYADCIAYIHPQEEDFGITAVEAMAAGRPVIAFHKGGALETVVEGVTGTFFDEQSWEALADTMMRFDNRKFDSNAIKKHAEQFSSEAFRKKIEHVVRRAYERHQVRCDVKI